MQCQGEQSEKFYRSRMTVEGPGRQRGRRAGYKMFAAALFVVAVVLLLVSLPGAATERVIASPPPEPTPSPLERLAEPALSDPPTQLEQGHHAYWFSCMVCHGDRGQGLTDEWRNINPPEDRDCWQSRCHAPNHPPEGFEIPRTAPAVMGPGALGSFKTAADLYAYIRETMPWAFPGERTEDEYWQITSYLADSNRVVLRDEDVGPDNAASTSLKLRYQPGQAPEPAWERIVTLVALALLLTALLLYRWMQIS